MLFFLSCNKPKTPRLVEERCRRATERSIKESFTIIIHYPLSINTNHLPLRVLLLTKLESLLGDCCEAIFKALQERSLFIFVSAKTNQKAFGYNKVPENLFATDSSAKLLACGSSNNVSRNSSSYGLSDRHFL